MSHGKKDWIEQAKGVYPDFTGEQQLLEIRVLKISVLILSFFLRDTRLGLARAVLQV